MVLAQNKIISKGEETGANKVVIIARQKIKKGMISIEASIKH